MAEQEAMTFWGAAQDLHLDQQLCHRKMSGTCFYEWRHHWGGSKMRGGWRMRGQKAEGEALIKKNDLWPSWLDNPCMGLRKHEDINWSYGLMTRGPGLCKWKQTTWWHLGTVSWTTIDEQLVPFWGTCKSLQYMPSKHINSAQSRLCRKGNGYKRQNETLLAFQNKKTLCSLWIEFHYKNTS